MSTTNIIMSTMVHIVSTVHTSHVNYGTYRVNYTYKPCNYVTHYVNYTYKPCQLYIETMSTTIISHVIYTYKPCQQQSELFFSC